MSERYSIIIETDNNKIIRAEIYDDDGNKLDKEIDEILFYIYEDCGGMNDVLNYEEKELEKASKIMAAREFEFEKFKSEVYDEAFKQAYFDPLIGIKSIIALPISKMLVDIKEKPNPGRIRKWFIENVIPPARKFLVAFLFGKQNVEEIDKVIEEGRKKIFGEA
jgi:hypothetical protein